jgi:hypothetical protein
MNSSLKKTIQINPELFKIQTSSKSKTKSNREKKSKSEKPITPNFLKKQLIERIKKYKKINEEIIDSKENTPNKETDEDDEFILSMNFLSSISNEKNKPTSNNNNNQIIPSNNLEIPKVHSNNLEIKEKKEISFSPSLQNVNIDLPLELIDIKQEEITNNIVNDDFPNTLELEPPSKINILSDNVPYGCLKNGTKPTYRSWLTQKNNNNNKPTFTERENITEREKKLNELKSKFKNEEPVYIKKITKKKYTLGKSKNYRKVGILIKDMNTRKKIIESHKNLKTHDIQDIKSFLRNKGLIKIGNHTPTDILRKMYESSILSGDITNINKDILLHNLLNDTASIN